MQSDFLAPLRAQLRGISHCKAIGKVTGIGRDHVRVSGLDQTAAIGDRVRIKNCLSGEILRIDAEGCIVMPEGPTDGIRLDMPVAHLGPIRLFPCENWLGRIIDANGQPMDGKPLNPGGTPYELTSAPPSPTERRGFGSRLHTGYAVFDTFLPLVKGQRIGLFAGSGVGKSRLIAALAQNMDADVVVIGLIGERGREVRDFISDTLGAEGLRRSIVVVATSDSPALQRARAAWSMMAIAEYFRDQGKSVLLLADSITRFAEAHREVAAAAGEPFGPSGFPASMTQIIMALAERAGPGLLGQGDITAIFSVLVAGSDMEGPVADTMRGVLDGHVVLDRDIAERGRYPAINLLKSISRSLPAAASETENAMINEGRRLLGAYDRAELMVQSGLYSAGSDALIDRAVAVWPSLDAFLAERSNKSRDHSFGALDEILG